MLDVAGVAGQGEGEGEGAAAAVGGGVAAAAAGAALLLQQVDLGGREGGNLKIMICYFFNGQKAKENEEVPVFSFTYLKYTVVTPFHNVGKGQKRYLPKRHKKAKKKSTIVLGSIRARKN